MTLTHQEVKVGDNLTGKLNNGGEFTFQVVEISISGEWVDLRCEALHARFGMTLAQFDSMSIPNQEDKADDES